MTFETFELSNYDGAPINLYEFTLGSTAWRYAAAAFNVSVGGNVFYSAAIDHESYSFSGSSDNDELTINLDPGLDVCDLYLGTPPSEGVRVTIYSLHHGDTDAAAVWSGFIKLGRRVHEAQSAFVCVSLLATLARNGLRLFWGRGCPHALYDRQCRVDKADYAVSVQVTSLNAVALTCNGLSALGDDYLAGGFLSFVHSSGALEHRAIETHTGNVIGLLGLSDGISAGDWITVYPGCSRTTATCETKFNNLDNYGGFPHLPTKSPFDGDPVF